MTWAILIATAIAALILLVTVVGYRLPKQHRASVSVRLDQSAADIWRTITEFSAWPAWNPSVKSMTRQADIDGHPVWLMVDGNGKLPSEVLELSAPSETRPGRLRTKIADPSLPFGGTWTWEVVPHRDGCSVTITEDGQIENPIFRFMARYVFGYSATAETFLKALARKFGESALPVAELR